MKAYEEDLSSSHDGGVYLDLISPEKKSFSFLFILLWGVLKSKMGEKVKEAFIPTILKNSINSRCIPYLKFEKTS